MGKASVAPSAAEQFRALVETDRVPKGPMCSVCKLPDGLPEMIATLHRSGREFNAMARALGKLGHKIQAQTVARHCRVHLAE